MGENFTASADGQKPWATPLSHCHTKGRLSDGMVTRSILLQINDSQLRAESWFRSKIHILFLRAYAWNDEIFFCLLRFTNNVWISSRRGAASHRSVEESIEWPSHLRGIGGAMAFEVVPTAAGRLHSDQYTKIIIINTPINLRVFPCCSRDVGISRSLQL